MYRSTWSLLGIEPTRDRDTIRRAYGKQLKTTNPEDDPEGFQALREALESALRGASASGALDDLERPFDDPSESHAVEPTHVVDEGARIARARALDVRLRYERASSRLSNALRSDPSDDAAIVEAFHEVVAAAAEADVSLQLEAEAFAIKLLASSIPRSDAILALAARTFAWNANDVGHPQSDHLANITKRLADLAYRDELMREGSVHNKAFTMLRTPSRRPTFARRLGTLGAPARARAFLATLRESHPDLEAELDERNVAAWDRFLGRPFFPTWALYAILATPGLWLLASIGGWSSPVAVMAFIVTQVSVIAVAFHYLVAWPRYALRTRLTFRVNAVVRFGWAPAGFALLLLTTFVPASRAMEWAVAICASAVALWAIITGEPDKRPGKIVWQARVMWSQSWLVIWWLLIAQSYRPERYAEASLGFFACVVASSAGEMSLWTDWLEPMSERRRRAVLYCFLPIVAAAAFSLAYAGLVPRALPFAVDLIVISVIGCRIFLIAYGDRLASGAGFAALVIFGVVTLGAFADLRNGPVFWGGTTLLVRTIARLATSVHASRQLSRAGSV